MKRKRTYQIGPFGQNKQEVLVCKSLNECRKMVYLHGKRGTTYHVDATDKSTGEIWESYEMLLSEAGIVFTRKIYDKWKILKLEAELNQKTIKFEK